jgi:NAD(P)-dependent dehydrogenase (short-subunit alcohol dehydrogenase family)
VIGVARDRLQLEEVGRDLGSSFSPVAADATDPTVVGQLLDLYSPTTLVLNAGASPVARPIHQHSWQTFSRNWDVDVKHVFHWLREALVLPLPPGSTIITLSSGAALRGSSIGGGYSGAKATIRFMTEFAADESDRADLGLRFFCVLPTLTPATQLGAAAAAGHARQDGVSVEAYLEKLGPTLTPQRLGEAIACLATDQKYEPGAYLVNATGLALLP